MPRVLPTAAAAEATDSHLQLPAAAADEACCSGLPADAAGEASSTSRHWLSGLPKPPDASAGARPTSREAPAVSAAGGGESPAACAAASGETPVDRATPGKASHTASTKPWCLPLRVPNLSNASSCEPSMRGEVDTNAGGAHGAGLRRPAPDNLEGLPPPRAAGLRCDPSPWEGLLPPRAAGLRCDPSPWEGLPPPRAAGLRCDPSPWEGLPPPSVAGLLSLASPWEGLMSLRANTLSSRSTVGLAGASATVRGSMRSVKSGLNVACTRARRMKGLGVACTRQRCAAEGSKVGTPGFKGGMPQVKQSKVCSRGVKGGNPRVQRWEAQGQAVLPVLHMHADLGSPSNVSPPGPLGHDTSTCQPCTRPRTSTTPAHPDHASAPRTTAGKQAAVAAGPLAAATWGSPPQRAATTAEGWVPALHPTEAAAGGGCYRGRPHAGLG
eukprot:364061-Chlamydomonas_euryale.AAC.2